MEAEEILTKKIIEHIRLWNTKEFERFKANCEICNMPLKAGEARFSKLETQKFFCKACWENSILPSLRKAKEILSSVEKDIVGCLYGLVFHSDLLRDDSDFAQLGKFVASVMKTYITKLHEAGFDPDAVMFYWPASLFKRLTGVDLPDDWANRLFTASVIEDVVRYHAAKGLFIYAPEKSYWEKAFRDAPAAYALRKEPLRKTRPEELLEFLRQAHR